MCSQLIWWIWSCCWLMNLIKGDLASPPLNRTLNNDIAIDRDVDRDLGMDLALWNHLDRLCDRNWRSWWTSSKVILYYPTLQVLPQPARRPERRARPGEPGMNCIKIGLPGKLILSKRKGLLEVLFSWNSLRESIIREDLFLYNRLQAKTAVTVKFLAKDKIVLCTGELHSILLQ